MSERKNTISSIERKMMNSRLTPQVTNFSFQQGLGSEVSKYNSNENPTR